MTDGPLLVYGSRSTTYDFGSVHPLTPRRFGPGIELLRAVGAEPGLAPEPATDDELLACHTARYIAAVRRLSDEPWGPPEAGIGPGDDPPFAGMHDAGSAVAGGSLRAMEAILRGDVEHAFHPGGGLHHAMPDRASGFCIYDDPALAISSARRAGLRVLYVDLDVHHGDGVQAIHLDDPGVLTVSFHESGRYLFPGTGMPDELGGGAAAGTSVNVPFEPYSGEGVWLDAVRRLVPSLAAAFGPDVVVSQHGADSHAWDPLAHLRVTTTAMGEAARIVDQVAHRHASGRWLSTGGGGYDVYRVVPRSWSLVWLAGAHREPPPETPVAWRERWAADADRHGQSPPPARFTDAPNAGLARGPEQDAAERQSAARAELVESLVIPAWLVVARERGWWSPDGRGAGAATGPLPPEPGPEPRVLPLDAEMAERLRLAPRTIPPADPSDGLAILGAALAAGATVVAAVGGDVIVGAAVAVPPANGDAPWTLAALGVAPAHRRHGLGAALVRELVARTQGGFAARVTVAERDPVGPLPVELRRSIGTRLLEQAGFVVRPADGAVARVDPGTIEATLRR